MLGSFAGEHHRKTVPGKCAGQQHRMVFSGLAVGLAPPRRVAIVCTHHHRRSFRKGRRIGASRSTPPGSEQAVSTHPGINRVSNADGTTPGTPPGTRPGSPADAPLRAPGGTGSEASRPEPTPSPLPENARPKACPCVKPGTRQSIYRVKAHEGSPWLISCPMCLGRFSQSCDTFVFGGRIGGPAARRWAEQNGTLCAPKVPLTIDRAQTPRT